MFDRLLRPVKASTLAPLARLLPGVRPGVLTAAGLALGLAAAATAALGAFAPALALWLGNRLLDGLDGELARRRGGLERAPSDVGGYHDLMADLTTYAAVTLGAAAGATATFTGTPLAPPATTWAWAAALLAAYYVNLGSLTVLAALLEKRGRTGAALGDATSVLIPAGLIEGTETIVLIALLLLLPAHLPLLLGVAAALVLLTAAQRVAWATGRLREAS